MSSTFNRRQRRHKSKQEKELMDKYKLRIPTAQEVEQYIIDKAGHNNFQKKMEELNKTIEHGM
jgi:hypothetical protein